MDQREMSIAINGSHAAAADMVGQIAAASGYSIPEDMASMKGLAKQLVTLVHYIAEDMLASRVKIVSKNPVQARSAPTRQASPGGQGSPAANGGQMATKAQKGLILHLMKEVPASAITGKIGGFLRGGVNDLGAHKSGDRKVVNWTALNSLRGQEASAVIETLNEAKAGISVSEEPVPEQPSQQDSFVGPDEAPW